jgi:hypothetical protein
VRVADPGIGKNMHDELLQSKNDSADGNAQGFHPCTPLKGLLKKSLKNLQNFKKALFIK